MRRFAVPLFILAGLAGLTVACYGRALFRGEQFSYRDAAHYYYPLHQRVQAEWAAGRLPLWEPEENSGMPLLGNPTAAVLYPGKVIFFLAPYPLAARLYIIAHTLLAFVAMVALSRTWGLSWGASGLAGLAYAFSGPVLFQFCNVIYLVGAAWAPLGFRAVDVWLRSGRRRGVLELALVLTMELLGGDPEAAYLTGLASVGYALWLAALGHEWVTDGVRTATRRGLRFAAGFALFVVWVAVTLAMGWLAPRVRTHQVPPQALPWMSWVPPVVSVAWGVVGLTIIVRWLRRPAGQRDLFVPMAAGLCLSAGLAGALAAAQLLPVFEFTSLSVRASGEGPHDIYPFSLSPWRVVEFFWPNPFGTAFNGNRSWVWCLPPSAKDVKVWVPSLYVGGLTVVLALTAAWGGRRSPGRAWMVGITLVSLLAAFGEFTGPLVWARFLPSVSRLVGPHDPYETTFIRLDDYLRDGDGGLYWMMATFFPGFRQFRFPSKLLTFTVMGVSALAAFGWDDLFSAARPARRRAAVWSALLFLLTAAALGTVLAYRADFTSWLSQQRNASPFGPFDHEGAVRETVRGLTQALLVLGGALAVVTAARHRPTVATAAALAVLTADLAATNARFVLTAPQSDFEETPRVLSIIREDEARNPATGPYRVHRAPIWNPIGWTETLADDRVRGFVEWERATLQPKYGINDGVNYTLAIGVAELYDYEFFFAGFPRLASAELARALRIEPGARVIYYPRRSFDMWTSRYFVLPYYPRWGEEQRGIAAFLDRTERVFPSPDAFRGPGGREREEVWIKEHDFQVLRNLAAFPRAWVVHEGRFLPPIQGMSRADRARPMEEILFANDAVWHDPTRIVYDPKTVAWIEPEDRPVIAPRLRGGPAGSSEVVNVVRYGSNRVELDANLESAGIVVLADIYYPGWALTIDGKAAPVYRVNRAMRGALVEKGRHRLIYTYRPESVRRGVLVTGVGFLALVALGIGAWRRPVSVRPPFDGPDNTDGGDAQGEPQPALGDPQSHVSELFEPERGTP